MPKVARLFTEVDTDVYDDVSWTTEDVRTYSTDGDIVYECRNAEFPATWSDQAKQIVASKYFRESRIAEEKEVSVKQMVERVVSAIKKSGQEQEYFKEEEDADIFANELRYILVNQLATFNSPVWFNVGVPGVENPQASACFINSVEDSMPSILQLAQTEGMIFKDGSGSGVNLSSLRGSNESIRGGGRASGPVSFMQGYDAFANVILSGGRTRRAARMVILNIDHPDIVKFITCKADQEQIVSILAEAGMSTEFHDIDSAYSIAKHQSGNNSVRVTDDFMQLVKDVLHGYKPDEFWELKNRVDGTVADVVSVKELFHQLAEAAHACGDPGIQFHDTVNRYNTCAADGTIEASNPCSEFMWLNNSACNLASINLDKFLVDARTFDHKHFRHVVDVMILAQDILIETAGYPTEEIEKSSHAYRPLGLGYANLGGLLMHMALPYDSEEGRDVAASITSMMTAEAYIMSSRIADQLGPFSRYEANKNYMEDVLDTHASTTRSLRKDVLGLSGKAVSLWQEVLGVGIGRRKSVDKGTGFRNAQVTLLAPTGTTAYMMDCATTGIEPDIGLQKTKIMVGGGVMSYANPNVTSALMSLGYERDIIHTLLDYIEEHGHLEGSQLPDNHLPVFDCALTMPGQERCITIDGHINMVAAVQPFLSGAVSKTFNMSTNSTVADIERTFLKAWERGLKCITIYRSGSKMSEPLRIRELKEKEIVRQVPQRQQPPDDVETLRHKFTIGTYHGYFHVGLDPLTEEPIELFIRMARFGSTVGGLLDSYATLFSKALQYNIPLEELISHMEASKFPPAGFTPNPKIPTAKSIMDYIARWMKERFLDEGEQEEVAHMEGGDDELLSSIIPEDDDIPDLSEDMCPQCGHPLVRTGLCSTCRNCSYNDGVCG